MVSADRAFAVRPLSPADHPLVRDLIALDAAAGHYDRRLADPATLAQFMAGFANGLRAGGIANQQGEIWRLWGLAVSAGTDFAGFAACRERTDALGLVELWMAGVLPASRGAGAGAALVDGAIVGATREGKSVMCRCMPASGQMKRMLLRRGFRQLGRGPEGADFLQFP